MKEAAASNIVCDSPVDLHLTSAAAPIAQGITVNLASEEAWLFFDNMKPSAVLKSYAQSILINGSVLSPTVNARITMYKHGTVVMPHGASFQPLMAFSEKDFQGNSAEFSLNKYYSNAPSDSVPANMREALALDNQIRSFKLKRGYMATFANSANGMGYSRVFIADNEDLDLSELPGLLDGKISFVRVFKWEYASKKGWAGSVWKEQKEGLKYVEEQCAITNSTWYYNWGATTDWTSNPNTKVANYDVEFIPEKWGAGGSWGSIFGSRNTSHLMGYNEPDHTEQSNVKVDRAIEEWPLLMQTGMRLGSPATTDFSWLYNFMNECSKRNYRVDYVVVHAYWASMSPHEWYTELKKIHDRTGRPLWIKEWNNGANWTKESWPSGTDAQQAKQLNDLKGILHMMDTTSFIERYSIYNWVEDKRAMLLSTGVLTPAGKFYAANEPELAFNRDKEVISTWEVREAPEAAYQTYTPAKGYTLSFSDYNGELINSFIVERAFKADGTSPEAADFVEIATLPASATEYTDTPIEGAGEVYYRIRAIDYRGKEKVSEPISYSSLDNSGSASVIGLTTLNTPWNLLTVSSAYEQAPVVLLGTSTFINKSPLSTRVRMVSPKSFEYKLAAYNYLQKPVYVLPDTLAYWALPAGTYNWGGLTAQAATINGVAKPWKTVTFSTPFNEVPVVFATQVTDNEPLASAVRVRNVTKTGFEVTLQYEKNITTTAEYITETISYLAVTQGKGTVGGHKIEVGCTPAASVGDERTGLYRIEYSETYPNSLFFGCMQTESDGIASALRIYERSDAYAEILKDYERSAGTQSVKKETVGWMVLSNGDYSTVEEMPAQSSGIVYDSCTELVSWAGFPEQVRITVYTKDGMKLREQPCGMSISLNGLPSGYYLIGVEGKESRLIEKM